jgi:hypothetical protein
MNFDRQRLVGVLITLATALFLMSVAPRFPYRRVARIGAVAVYGAALIGVAVWVALWLLGVVPGN